jgi:hypothetical protein
MHKVKLRYHLFDLKRFFGFMNYKVKCFICLGVFFSLCIGVFADDLQEINAAKQEYTGSGSAGGETARITYVSRLTDILIRLIGEHMTTGANPPPGDFDLLDAELKRHPAPDNSDSEQMSRLRIGKWESPRHDYLYRRDGTWCMLPYEPGVTAGHWHIRGNQYFDGVKIDPRLNKYTIILLSKEKFIFTDGTNVFCEWRIAQQSN